MASTIPRDFVDLQSASNRINGLVNIIGIVTDVLPITPSRGTDWMCTFSIADHTFGQCDNGLKVRFFKPEPELPKIHGTGDVVVLRNIKISLWSGMTIALASYATRWTVIPAHSIPQKPFFMNATAEMLHAISLCNSHDKSSFTSPSIITPRISSIAPLRDATPLVQGRRDKFSSIKDVEVGKFYDLVGQVVKIYPANGLVELYITDYTSNKLLFNYERRGHEEENAREGDEFSYLPRSSSHKSWPGPFGRLTLMVALWPAHSYFAQTNVKERNFVYLRNVHIKYSKDGKVEGAMHTDTRQNDRVDVSILKDHRDDENVKNVLRRKKEYTEKFDNKLQDSPGEPRGVKRKSAEKNETLSKKQARRRRRQPKEELAHAPTKTIEKQVETEDPQIIPQPKPSKQELNKNIRSSHLSIPPRPLSSILSLSHHALTTPDGTPYTLPFQNINSCTIVRIIDFFPHDLADFAVRCPRVSEFDVLSDHENSDTTDDESDESEDDERRWEWRFGFVLEDAMGPPSEKKATMKVYVADKDAEFLLKLDAENLRASPTALASLREKLFLLWGDLEERKSSARQPLQSISANLPAKTATLSSRPADTLSATAAAVPQDVAPPKSLPFQCCIKEYGVRSRGGGAGRRGGDEGSGADEAGNGAKEGGDRDGVSESWGWERKWRLWGATIV